MNRIFLCLSLFAVAGLSPAFGQTVVPVDYAQAALDAITASNIPAAEQHFSAIRDPAAKLYVLARIARANGEPEDAIRMLARLIVRYPNDEKWTAISELQSAELYLELGMLDAANVTARQIQQLHTGTDVAEKATALRERIKQDMEQAAEAK